MWIYEALRGVELLERTSSTVDVSGVQYDSRKVKAGDVFVAMRGGSTDGNRFVAGALERGAAAVVTDSREVFEAGGKVPVYLVANGRRALAGIAANLLGHPGRRLKVCAVTGTNGKTTTAFLLEQLLRAAERKCVLIGTIETHIGDEVRASAHTTPEASDLLQIFADGVAVGCTEAVMEMSSHALEQERVWGVQVDVGIFTNLTQDHLDYHGSMEAYGAAKAKLFRGVGAAPPRVAVVNLDDAFAGTMLLAARECPMVWTCSLVDKDASFYASEVRLSSRGATFQLCTPFGQGEVESALAGRVNVQNLVAAVAAALAQGLTLAQVLEFAPGLRAVPGRFEAVPNDLGITVIVDYAHTEDALRNLIALGRELVGTGRVITLFGCGGDRDRTKRPKMGRAAGEGSDVVVLTSDNPRGEEARAILEEALAGVRETGTRCVVEVDRAVGIGVAIGEARAGDVVLIAGKGHEKVQIFADRVVPFDDVAVAAGVLRGRTRMPFGND